jgi:5-methylcytosine-specific restriction endonuclease McrA
MKDKERKYWLRVSFNKAVFERDGYKCRVCGKPNVTQWGHYSLAAHHICDRHDMPNGGYVPENGISLCETCHWEAEREHNNQSARPGYSRQELYELIGTSFDEAWNKSEALK